MEAFESGALDLSDFYLIGDDGHEEASVSWWCVWVSWCAHTKHLTPEAVVEVDEA